MQHSVHGVVPGFPAVPSAYASKELLEDIVGALGIDGDLPLGRHHFDGIGEEFIPVFVDLFGHFFAESIRRRFGILFELFSELSNALTDAGHDLWGAIVIEALAAIRQGDAHGLAEKIEDLGSPAEFFNRLA